MSTPVTTQNLTIHPSSVGIGVDIGGSHISCCAVDLTSGRPIKGTHFDKQVDRKASKEKIFETWAIPINQTIQAVNDTSIVGIGCAMPGAFNYREGIALFEGNDKYESLHNINVKKEFAAYLNLQQPEIRFINDASAFGIGSAWSGVANDYHKSIALTFGTGIGATFIEAGIPIIDRSDVPPHGSLWHLPFKEGIADDYFSTRWFVNAYQERFNAQAIGVKEIANAAQQDPSVQELFDEFGRNLAEFLTPWLRSFQPELLVLGGNVAKSWFLMEASFQSVLTTQNILLKIMSSALMEEAALIGAARLLDDSFWERVKENLPIK